MYDLRIESRFKNANLYNSMLTFCLADAVKRQSNGYPLPLVHVFSELCGISSGVLSNLLNLKLDPRLKSGDLRPSAIRICDATKEDAEFLFPRHLYSMALPRVVVREVDSVTMVALSAASSVTTDGIAQIEAPVLEAQRDAGVRRLMLDSLNPLQEKIINLRFGLNGCEEHTLEQVAIELRVSRERVRQIEAKALMKLRERSQYRDSDGAPSFRETYQLI